MNSTHNYSIQKIEAENIHFLLNLNTGNEIIKLIFSNAEGFDKREVCMGIEIDNENELNNPCLKRASDFMVHGTYDLKKAGEYKITFSVKSRFLSGNYVLMRPAWARSAVNNIWLLIPSNSLK